MQTIKIILGVILAIASINVIITMSAEEKGAGLAGAITGFLILASIAGWLIHSGTKRSKSN